MIRHFFPNQAKQTEPQGRFSPAAPASRRRYLSLLTVALLSLCTACTPGGDLPWLPNPDVRSYHLGTDDVVRVITFGEQQPGGDFRVGPTGDIALPLLGAVRASGLTAHQLQQEIATDLERKHLFTNPSISVEVMSYRPFFILGEVNKPGEYPYQPGMTVLTAVAIAGGFTYRAVKSYASIVRTTDHAAVEGRVDRQSFVKPGDVITIYERRF